MKGRLSPKSMCVGLVCSLVALANGATVEAETQSLGSGAVVHDSVGVSGGKYVSANGMTFTVTVDTTGIYDLSVAMWVKQYDWFNSSIFLNGSTSAIATFLTNSPSKVFTTYTLQASGKLTAGKNTITVSGGAANFDCLTLVRHPAATFTLDAKPVSPNATESARKLKAFLTGNFGSKTISGMMIGDNAFNYDYGKMRLIETCVPADSCKVADSLTTFRGQEDIRLFKQRSGEYPALGGFDMLFAAGGHSDEGWFRGYTDNNLRMAKELWKLGGIPAFTWHWKVGKDTVFYVKTNGFRNTACKDGTQGSSADNTCFNYTKAFTDSTCAEANLSSPQYKAMMADVDSLSRKFLQLQDSGVAAVWRPLHEAAGGWFWWGIGGSTCYKSLYRLVYDRMVKTNGVRNLIWVWNIERDPAIGYDCSALNPAWYPGDDFVDVIGVDIYNSANDQKSNINCYSKIVEGMGTRKILSLTENGPIPDVDSMATDGAMWSWWMPWYNTWSSGFLNQTADNVWARNLKDPRIVSLGRMPGWSNVVAGAPSRGQQTLSQARLRLHGRMLHVSLPEGAAKISIHDPRGHLVAERDRGSGSLRIDLGQASRGILLVRIAGDREAEIRSLVVH